MLFCFGVINFREYMYRQFEGYSWHVSGLVYQQLLLNNKYRKLRKQRPNETKRFLRSKLLSNRRPVTLDQFKMTLIQYEELMSRFVEDCFVNKCSLDIINGGTHKVLSITKQAAILDKRMARADLALERNMNCLVDLNYASPHCSKYQLIYLCLCSHSYNGKLFHELGPYECEYVTRLLVQVPHWCFLYVSVDLIVNATISICKSSIDNGIGIHILGGIFWDSKTNTFIGRDWTELDLE